MDTPIFDALWAKYNATPIFDALVEKHEMQKYYELVKPYQPTPTTVPWVMWCLYPQKKKEKPLMNTWQRLVNEFREAMDLPVSEFPRTLSPEEAALHIKMIRDEFEKEFVPAFENQDLVEMYDAGIDMIVYVIGALSNAGFDIDPGFKHVMANNMSKINPATGKPDRAGPDHPTEPEGKILKPEGYRPVNLHPIINAQFQFGPEDTTVYRTKNLPLTYGEGGPVIGKADVVMDHNGVMTIDAVVEDVDVLPMLEAVSLSDVYVPENPPQEEDVVEEVELRSFADEPIITIPQILAEPEEGDTL